MTTKHLFAFTETPSTVPGLKFIPTLGSTDMDNMDFIDLVQEDGTHLQEKHSRIHPQFSTKDKEVLAAVLEDKKKEGTLNAILEIGVHRSGDDSSTMCILKTKNPSTKYLGVDLESHAVGGVRDEHNNVFGLQANSSDLARVVEYANSIGIGTFDVIHIDGYHSVSQVVADWKYTALLNKGGVVLFHDTNYHPGPYCVFEAIDETMFDKTKHLTKEEFDWGVATAKKLV